MATSHKAGSTSASSRCATFAADDVALDYAEWANPWTWGQNQSFNTAINVILNDYAVRRRNHLFVNHSVNNPGFPDNAGIPDAQGGNVALSIGAIDFNPASGDQDQEYIEIINNNSFAIDLTGWTVQGAITHSFAPGTIIGAGQSLYITPKSSAFRARTAGPSGGQGLLVQQWDAGHLSSFGETITIKRDNATTAATQTFAGNPSLTQQHLRITEVHYNPTGPSAAELNAGLYRWRPIRIHRAAKHISQRPRPQQRPLRCQQRGRRF